MAALDFFDAVSRVTVSSALDGLWKGLVVTLAVACLLYLVRWLNARTRYVIWTATLMVVFALSWSEIWKPPNRAGAARMWFKAAETNDPETNDSRKPGEAAAFESPPGADQPRDREHAEPAFTPELPGRWPPVVFAVWMLVSLTLSAKIYLGVRHVRRLKQSAKPLPARYQDRLRHLIRSSETRRWVRLCSSTRVGTPAATGLFRPVILIPGPCRSGCRRRNSIRWSCTNWRTCTGWTTGPDCFRRSRVVFFSSIWPYGGLHDR